MVATCTWSISVFPMVHRGLRGRDANRVEFWREVAIGVGTVLYGGRMAERGARPKIPKARRRFLRAVRHLFSPLRPDDYLELINGGLVSATERRRGSAAARTSGSRWFMGSVRR